MNSVVLVCKECGERFSAPALQVGSSRPMYPIFCWKCIEEMEANALDQERRYESAMMVKRSQIPYKYNKMFISSGFSVYDHQDKLHEYIISMDLFSKRYPFIWGPPGTGKSMLGCFLLYRYIKETHNPSFFFSMTEFISDKYGTIEDPNESLFDHNPIMIDDLGNHLMNEKILSFLFKVLTYRMERSYPTIITSNSNPVELGKRIISVGKNTDSVMTRALVDRILELCRPFKLDGESIRVRNFIRRSKNE